MDIFVAVILVASLILGLLVVLQQRGPIRARFKPARSKGRILEEDILKLMLNAEWDSSAPDIEHLASLIGRPSDEVSAAVSRLVTEGLIATSGATWQLTVAGREAALSVIRAHRIWERFLADQTGYPQKEWHGRAEREEHRIGSEELADLAARLGNPVYDPHGDPIPTESGELPAQSGLPLAKVTAGYAGQIQHLEDEPDAIYVQLLQHGLAPGLEIYILESSPSARLIWVDGRKVLLPLELCANVFITILPDWDIMDKLPHDRLSSLKPGEAGVVRQISPFLRSQERRRLMDLGIVPGTRISSEFESPSGEPVAYEIRGTLIALRRDQSDYIRITPTRD